MVYFIRGHHSIAGGGGAVVYLSRTHYLFQLGSAASRKFPILSHEKISHFFKCSSPPPGDWMVATFSV